MTWFWILVGIFVLGLMVLVHEWGHFVVAKLLGVRVDVFSIGFGPRIFGWRRGATDYRVSVLPLGGYVRMAGDNPSENREGAPDEFLSQARWRRALIVFAGPATNVVVAVLLLTGLYAVRFEKPAFLDEPARLEGVVPDSPAARVGLQAGDVIVEIAGARNPTWEKIQVETLLGGKESLTVTVARGEAEFTATVQPELQGPRQTPVVGWYPYDPVVVTSAEPDLPAARAGLKAGDEIVAVDAAPTSEIGPSGLVERVQGSKGAELTFTLRRNGQPLELSIAAEERTWRGQTGYFLGVSLGRRLHSVHLGPVAAFRQSIEDNLRFTGLLFALLQRLFTGRASVSSLEGPIGIVSLSGQAAQLGLGTLASLMAIISINLAVLNLLPVPILDGGHLALLAVEGVWRRDLSLGFKERATQVGLVLLLLLFAVVMYNDIMRYFIR
ncbi:MAG: RIP metalloprotease RseP [Candidatus Acidiferrales bacterium]